MLHGLLAGGVSTLFWVAAQNVWMHIRPTPRRFHAIVLGYIVSLPLVFFVYRGLPVWWQPAPGEEPLMGWIHAYVLHFLLFAFYGECFFHVERSVTLRLLVEILHAGPEGADLEGLRCQYPVGDMIAQRLEVLRENGFVCLEGDRWLLLPKARRVVWFAILGNWLFRAAPQNERE